MIILRLYWRLTLRHFVLFLIDHVPMLSGWDHLLLDEHILTESLYLDQFSVNQRCPRQLYNFFKININYLIIKFFLKYTFHGLYVITIFHIGNFQQIFFNLRSLFVFWFQYIYLSFIRITFKMISFSFNI